MGESELFDELDVVAATDPEASSRPLTHAVQREDRRLVEGRREEGACRMRLVVLEEDEAPLVCAVQAVSKLTGCVELLLQPEWKPHQEELEARRGVGQVGLEDPFEFEQRLVVEDDEIELAPVDARFAKAVVDRLLGEAVVVLLAGKALFLGSRDNFSVAHERGGAVMIVRGDPENVHDLAGCWRVESSRRAL